MSQSDNKIDIFKYSGIFLIIFGSLLLLINFLGKWTYLGNYKNRHQPRKWERFDPDLVDKLDSFDSLKKYISNKLSSDSTKRDIMKVLFDTVTNRFTHKRASHNIFSNYILYVMGKIHPAFAHIYNPKLMVSNGYSLLCSQSSYLLLTLALEYGVKGRHVGLFGHVVMEAWYDSDWHLYDPDLEVIPLNKNRDILSVEELAFNKKLLKKYYEKHNVSKIIKSRQNNTYMTYPAGANFNWKTNVLKYFEYFMEIFKFVFPVLIILVGIAFYSISNSKKIFLL